MRGSEKQMMLSAIHRWGVNSSNETKLAKALSFGLTEEEDSFDLMACWVISHSVT